MARPDMSMRLRSGNLLHGHREDCQPSCPHHKSMCLSRARGVPRRTSSRCATGVWPFIKRSRNLIASLGTPGGPRIETGPHSRRDRWRRGRRGDRVRVYLGMTRLESGVRRVRRARAAEPVSLVPGDERLLPLASILRRIRVHRRQGSGGAFREVARGERVRA